jgi:hypothetical protein
MVLVSFWIALLLVISFVLHLLHFVDTVIDASVGVVDQFLLLVIVYVLGAIVCLCIAICSMMLSLSDFVRTLLLYYALFGS